MHNNLKDPPSMFASFLCYYMVFYYIKHKKVFYLIMSAIAFALAFNSKLYNIFIPLVIIIWFFANRIKPWNKRSRFEILKHSLIFLIVFLLFLNILNPIYWKELYILEISKNKIQNFLPQPTIYFGEIGLSTKLPFHYPFIMLGITTPPIILFFLILGIITISKQLLNQKNNLFNSLVLLGFFIPILKYSLLHISIFNGTRHLMDSFPFLFIISGIGASKIYSFITTKFKIVIHNNMIIKIFVNLIFVIFFLFTLLPIIKYHPYQHTYYNFLTGGLKGAENKFEIEYWGSSYKEGCDWINKNIEPNAIIFVIVNTGMAEFYLNSSYNIQNLEKKSQLNRTDTFYIITPKMKHQPNWIKFIPEIEKNNKPIYSIKRLGISLFDIYRINKTINNNSNI